MNSDRHNSVRLQNKAGQVLLVGLLYILSPLAFGSDPYKGPQFNAVDGIEGELVVAVGDNGAILHYQHGLEPTRMPSHTSKNLVDVHVGSRQFALAVGSNILLQWDGLVWSKVAQVRPFMTYSGIWASPDGKLVLLGGRRDGEHIVCPLRPNAGKQPFCRRFGSPMLDACGTGQTVLIALADGELHRVNNVLIGANGKFDPVFRPQKSLELSTAWLPQRDCERESGLPGVVAVDSDGRIVHFNGRHWQVLDGAPDMPRISRFLQSQDLIGSPQAAGKAPLRVTAANSID
jgi:hypothetical protein